MRSLTARQKRAGAGAIEPLAGLAFGGYRALSWRDPAPGLRALQEPEAAAVGAPVVTFFGPSEPWKYHPYGVPYRLLEVDLECRPCDYVHCVWPDDLQYQCMTRQSPDAIIQAVLGLLAGNPLRTSSSNADNAERNRVT